MLMQAQSKKLKDPCSNVRTKEDFLDQVYSDNIRTTRNRSTFSNCLDNIQSNLNIMSQRQAEEEATIPSSPDINEPEVPSEDCQSPLGCPGASDSA